LTDVLFTKKEACGSEERAEVLAESDALGKEEKALKGCK